MLFHGKEMTHSLLRHAFSSPTQESVPITEGPVKTCCACLKEICEHSENAEKIEPINTPLFLHGRCAERGYRPLCFYRANYLNEKQNRKENDEKNYKDVVVT